MKFDSRITFPYPVLGIRNDINGEPEFEYELSDDGTNHVIDIKIKLNNPSIKFYIDTKRAKYVCEVDCSKTYYRVSEKYQQPVFHVKIPKRYVSGEVNVTLTVTAVKDISDYTNSLANQDYSGYVFNLESGDLLAYIGTLSIQTDIMSDEYKAVGSFIHFKGAEVADISYNLTGQDIEVILPQEMFNVYSERLKGKSFRPAIIASVVKEAIVFALMNYKGNEELRWARILASAEVLKDYDLDDEMDIQKAIEMSSVLLKNPHKELFDKLEDIVSYEEENEN